MFCNILENNFVGVLRLILFCVLVRKISKAHASCTSLEFECDNGSCISTFSQCDGVRNCPDGSDETALNCIQQRAYCTNPYFRCAYGACVIGDANCNGQRDCSDGSDETLLRCGSDDDRRQFERRLRGNCAEDEMKCPSGICLANHKKCDGRDDCGDGADENVALCGHLECPAYAFACGYGGCIADALKCNQQPDCHDGSDESPLLCNYTRATTATANILPTLVTTTPATLAADSDNGIGCPLPVGAERPLMRDVYGSVITPPIIKGEVHFACQRGFTLVGESVSFCGKRKWSAAVPKCVKYCEPTEIVGGYTTVPTCHYEGQSVNCNRKHLPGTIVTFLCSTYFTNVTSLPTLRCLPGGTWSGYRQRCSSECGQIATPTKEFSAYGFTVNNSIVPWHVGIYNHFDEQSYKFTCGGTILTPDLIITAAHCVWDLANRVAYSPDMFQVVAAKFYRSYLITESTAVYRNITQIRIADNYKGASTNHLSDVALLILDKPFQFSNMIRSVCLVFHDHSEKDFRVDNLNGRFAGWDVGGEHTFQFIEARSKSFQKCVVENRVNDLATDKFCLFPKAGARACRGDSGSGFTHRQFFRQFWRDPERHGLYGIISNAPRADQCASGLIVLTNVQYYQGFIEHYQKESYQARG